jgi:hypothetical protein
VESVVKAGRQAWVAQSTVQHMHLFWALAAMAEMAARAATAVAAAVAAVELLLVST